MASRRATDRPSLSTQGGGAFPSGPWRRSGLRLGSGTGTARNRALSLRAPHGQRHRFLTIATKSAATPQIVTRIPDETHMALSIKNEEPDRPVAEAGMDIGSVAANQAAFDA